MTHKVNCGLTQHKPSWGTSRPWGLTLANWDYSRFKTRINLRLQFYKNIKVDFILTHTLTQTYTITSPTPLYPPELAPPPTSSNTTSSLISSLISSHFLPSFLLFYYPNSYYLPFPSSISDNIYSTSSPAPLIAQRLTLLSRRFMVPSLPRQLSAPLVFRLV